MKIRRGFAMGSSLGSCCDCRAPIPLGVQPHPFSLERMRIQIRHGRPGPTPSAVKEPWSLSGAGRHPGQSLGARREDATQTRLQGGGGAAGEAGRVTHFRGGNGKGPSLPGDGADPGREKEAPTGHPSALLNISPVRTGQGWRPL